MSQDDRMSRACDYVCGRLGEEARARAKRDMEVDAEFRHCVAAAAAKISRQSQDLKPSEPWDDIRRALATLPHLEHGKTCMPSVARPLPAAGREPAQGTSRQKILILFGFGLVWLAAYWAGLVA